MRIFSPVCILYKNQRTKTKPDTITAGGESRDAASLATEALSMKKSELPVQNAVAIRAGASVGLSSSEEEDDKADESWEPNGVANDTLPGSRRPSVGSSHPLAKVSKGKRKADSSFVASTAGWVSRKRAGEISPGLLAMAETGVLMPGCVQPWRHRRSFEDQRHQRLRPSRTSFRGLSSLHQTARGEVRRFHNSSRRPRQPRPLKLDE